MVGRAITRFLKNNSYENLLLPNRKDLDLLNTKEVENWFYENKPEVVIIAAAKVGGIQANVNYPFEFLSENIKIQQNLIETSFKNNVKLNMQNKIYNSYYEWVDFLLEDLELD